MFAAPSLDGATREQYAAMEAGGGTVAAPPKQGELADRQAAGRHGRQSEEQREQARPKKGKLQKIIGSLLPMLLRSSARARGNEINAARRYNMFRTFRFAVF